MAKLGSLLLRGFTNAKKRRRQKARQGISVAQKNSGKFKKISSITKSRLSKASPESEDAKLLKDAVERNKQLNKQLKKQLSQQGLSKSNLPSVTIKPTASMSSGTELTSKELIRPDEKLLKSMEAFLRDQRSQHTKRAYGKDLKRFVKFLIGKDQTLDRALLISYKDSLLSEGLEHTTIDRHLATLRSFFRWLVDDGVITKSPVENVRFLNPRRESRTVGFTDEEVRKVLATPNLYTKIGSLHYAILMVLFFCGLRRSELCSIRTSHIGFERGHHYFRLQGKGNAERIVVMVEPVWKALKHYLIMSRKDIQVDQPLFHP